MVGPPTDADGGEGRGDDDVVAFAGDGVCVGLGDAVGAKTRIHSASPVANEKRINA